MRENTSAAAVKAKLMTWKLSEDMTVLTLETSIKTIQFNILDFFKSVKWERLEQVEKLAVINGLKQKLSDKTAASKELQLSLKEKLDVIEAAWKQLTEGRMWNKPSEGRKAAVSKIDSALGKATLEELAMMLKLGLVDQKKYDAEITRRKETE